MMKQYKGFKITTYMTATIGQYKYRITKQGFKDTSIINFLDEEQALQECVNEIDGGLFDDLYQNYLDEKDDTIGGV